MKHLHVLGIMIFVACAFAQAQVQPKQIDTLVQKLTNASDRYDRGMARQLLAQYGARQPDLVVTRLPERVENREIQAALTTLRNEIAWGNLRHRAHEIAGTDKALLSATESLFTDYMRNVFFYLEAPELYADPADCFPTRSAQMDMRNAFSKVSQTRPGACAEITGLFLDVPHPRLREAAVWCLARMDPADRKQIDRMIASRLEDPTRAVQHAAAHEICRLHKLFSKSEHETYTADRDELHRLATAWWAKAAQKAK